MNERTRAAIATLHPKVRDEVTKLVEMVDKLLTGHAEMVIVQAIRTFPEQHALFLQRPKVTNADAGQSFHNYGLAFDFCLKIDGKTISWDTVKDWDGDNVPDWNEVVKVFVDAGWKWGKAFNDLPHLEKAFGFNWRDLLKMYQANKFIPGTHYVAFV